MFVFFHIVQGSRRDDFFRLHRNNSSFIAWLWFPTRGAVLIQLYRSCDVRSHRGTYVWYDWSEVKEIIDNTLYPHRKCGKIIPLYSEAFVANNNSAAVRIGLKTLFLNLFCLYGEVDWEAHLSFLFLIKLFFDNIFHNNKQIYIMCHQMWCNLRSVKDAQVNPLMIVSKRLVIYILNAKRHLSYYGMSPTTSDMPPGELNTSYPAHHLVNSWRVNILWSQTLLTFPSYTKLI